MNDTLDEIINNATDIVVDNVTTTMETIMETVAPPEYKAFMEGSRFWIQRVLVPFVVSVGVVGNVVTIVVLTRRRMRSSTNVYLTALAISDLLYLLFLFSLSLAHYKLQGITADAYWTYWRFGIWLTDATSSTSIWLTVSFTVERYIAVCHPLKGKMYCTEPRARRVIMVVFVLCFLSTASTPFEWQTERVPIHDAAKTVLNITANSTEPVPTKVRVTLSELGNLTSYRTVFYWFSSIVFVFLPLILLIVFNTILILAVHRSHKQRRHLTQSERHYSEHGSNHQSAQQENKITIILIAVVVLFLICQIPTAITLIYSSLSEEPEPHSTKDYVLRGLGNIFNLLVAINAACNFLLYCALSDKYRRTFAMTFLPRRCWARRDRLIRNTTMGYTANSYIDESPARRSRSPSVWRNTTNNTNTTNNDGVTSEYLQVPLNGRSVSFGDKLKRHQSAYTTRDRQVQIQNRRVASPTSPTSPSTGITRTKSLMNRVEQRESLLQNSSSNRSHHMSLRNRSESSSILSRCFKTTKPSNNIEVCKITISDTSETDGLSSV